MARTKLQKLFKEVEKEQDRLKNIAKRTKSDAQDISISAAGSRSVAGDVFHAKAQADMVTESLKKTRGLYAELKKAVKKDIPTKIEVPCYVKMAVDGGARIHRIYLVNSPVNLKTKIAVVSLNSPMGKKLVGKKVNSHVSFQAQDGSISEVVIKEIG